MRDVARIDEILDIKQRLAGHRDELRRLASHVRCTAIPNSIKQFQKRPCSSTKQVIDQRELLCSHINRAISAINTMIAVQSSFKNPESFREAFDFFIKQMEYIQQSSHVFIDTFIGFNSICEEATGDACTLTNLVLAK